MGKNINCMIDVTVHGLTIENRFAILEIGGGSAGPAAPPA